MWAVVGSCEQLYEYQEPIKDLNSCLHERLLACKWALLLHEIFTYAQLHQSFHILHVEVVRVCSDVSSRAVDNPRALVRERVPDVNTFPWKGNRMSWPSTVLQAGTSRVRDPMRWIFLIYLIIPAKLGPAVYSTSNRNEYQKQKYVSGE
jgi:hypothetical protein